MKPKISIITPCYNQGHFLEENILSVINENYPNVEHIVIDDGSTDNTRQVIEKYKDKLAYFETQTNSGQSAALNKAFSKATGEIIGWLNSDDYYAPGALHAIGDAFSQSSANVICGYSIWFDETGWNMKADPTITDKRGLAFHMRFPDINQPPTFFRKETMAEIFPLNTSLKYVMDREMWIKYLQLYGVSHAKTIDDILVYFRYHSTSNSQTKSDRFHYEYATILHWLAKKNGLDEAADLLASFYPLTPNYVYAFNKYPDKNTTLDMLRYFFLKIGGLVFNKEQFDYAKEGYKVFDIKNYVPLPEEKAAMERMDSVISCVNWTHFRVKRKLVGI